MDRYVHSTLIGQIDKADLDRNKGARQKQGKGRTSRFPCSGNNKCKDSKEKTVLITFKK